MKELPTITSKNQELIVVAEIVHNNVRVRSDYLLFWCQFSALLEFEIANGSRERQVSVHSAKINKAAGSRDPCLFA